MDIIYFLFHLPKTFHMALELNEETVLFLSEGKI